MPCLYSISEKIMPLPVETCPVETKKVACAGDKGDSHPRVFLIMCPQAFVDCPYCGKRYVLKESAWVNDDH